MSSPPLIPISSSHSILSSLSLLHIYFSNLPLSILNSSICPFPFSVSIFICVNGPLLPLPFFNLDFHTFLFSTSCSDSFIIFLLMIISLLHFPILSHPVSISLCCHGLSLHFSLTHGSPPLVFPWGGFTPQCVACHLTKRQTMKNEKPSFANACK